MRVSIGSVLRRLGLYNAAVRLSRWPPVVFARDVISVATYDRATHDRIVERYRHFVQRDDLCFDVGANLGHRVHALLEVGARVVAVEPQARCLRVLRMRFRRNERVVLVPYGLSDQEGTTVLHTSDAHAISSMSTDWITAVKSSGRFSGYAWASDEVVPLTTLDKLIAQYGRPRFCKIDVEGFEVHVLRGLSQPIDIVVFEFVPEFIDAALTCTAHLAGLDEYEFNYSLGESMELALAGWVGPDEVSQCLQGYEGTDEWGDVYARRRSAVHRSVS